ncbi:MAG: hypothetical protein K0Q57_88 [Gammaproteobacteria bacterium]|jgi:Tfp pilus assembly protein PilE|nr:hypothetical protein [Gammaproteobacteria bacterium]
MKKFTKNGRQLRHYGMTLLQIMAVVIVIGVLITVGYRYFH